MQSQAAFMTYAPFHAPAAFRWWGGAYIEIHAVEDGTAYETPADIINVWDYETDAPRIPRTLDAFQARCDEWIAEHAEELV